MPAGGGRKRRVCARPKHSIHISEMSLRGIKRNAYEENRILKRYLFQPQIERTRFSPPPAIMKKVQDIRHINSELELNQMKKLQDAASPLGILEQLIERQQDRGDGFEVAEFMDLHKDFERYETFVLRKVGCK